MKKPLWMLPLTLTSLLYAQPPGGSGDGVWLRNAYFGEAQSFDACVGHQPGNGQYHHHADPVCLRAQLNDNVELLRNGRTGAIYREKAAPWKHSPILGWAFDGYPIYGPYGYSDAGNAASAVKRMKSSFRLRNITDRTSLPDWAIPLHTGVAQQLSAAQYGPKIGGVYPLGRYVEDYEYVQGLGDLDVYNGRFTVTPEFPQGTYAYYVTIDDNGLPAFPFIFGAQFYGTATGGTAANVPAAAIDYFANGAPAQAASNAPLLNSWMTHSPAMNAQIVSGFDPSAGPQSTWPVNVPAGARISGGVSAPTPADAQRIRYSDTLVWVNANGLASYRMGPWFEPQMAGGVFGNFPSQQNVQMQFPRAPAAATARKNVGMGAQGIWVNGVAVFNFLDGASYSIAQSADVGGGIVTPAAFHVSAASFEPGPLAPGSLATAFSLFNVPLATATDTAATANWPTTLGGATVSVRDSGGVTRPAAIYFASPAQVNYRIPPDAASGNATVTIVAGSSTSTGNITIRQPYPHLFLASATAQAAAQLTRLHNNQQTTEPVPAAIDLGPAADQVYLIVYGSGLGTATSATATIGGVRAEVTYAGAQGGYAGLDQYNIAVPRELAGKGKVDVVITVDGKPSNPVNVTIQ